MVSDHKIFSLTHLREHLVTSLLCKDRGIATPASIMSLRRSKAHHLCHHYQSRTTLPTILRPQRRRSCNVNHVVSTTHLLALFLSVISSLLTPPSRPDPISHPPPLAVTSLTPLLPIPLPTLAEVKQAMEVGVLQKIPRVSLL